MASIGWSCHGAMLHIFRLPRGKVTHISVTIRRNHAHFRCHQMESLTRAFQRIGLDAKMIASLAKSSKKASRHTGVNAL